MPVIQSTVTHTGAGLGDLVGGSVDVNAGTPNRTASMTFVDSTYSLSAAEAGNWIGQEISITVNGNHCFIGPISTLVMSDRVLQLEAVDRSAYGLSPTIQTSSTNFIANGSLTIRSVISSLVALMGHGVGFSNPQTLCNTVLQNSQPVERGVELWTLASELAAGQGAQLVMTRDGNAKLTNQDTALMGTLTLEDHIVSQPAIGFDLLGSGFRNYVDVVGNAACSDEMWHVTAEASGVLSPGSLGRHFVHEMDLEDIIDESQLQDIANDVAASLSQYTATSNLEVLNQWAGLEPYNLLGTPYGDVRITNMSIPLDGTSTMSIGVNKRYYSKFRRASWR